MRTAVWLLAFVALAALAQQETRDKGGNAPKGEKAAKSQEKQAPQPLFQNKLGFTAAKSTKESTTLGFNGIDPSGKVDQELLAKAPTAEDEEKVRLMAANQPPPADLIAFLNAGGLKRK